jgi:hypothetical protein
MKWILAAVLVLTASACKTSASAPEPFCVGARMPADCERGYIATCNGGWDYDAGHTSSDWTGPNCDENLSPTCATATPHCIRDPRVNLDGDAGL